MGAWNTAKCKALAVAIIAGALALMGCPSNMCLLKICKGNPQVCRCSWSTCPDGSDYDVNTNACVCLPGRISLSGGCLSLAEANAYCGKGAHYESTGCVRTTCAAGQELDLDTGVCLAKHEVDKVARNSGVQVGASQKLACPPGFDLVVENQQAACVPKEKTCSRDQVWNGTQCVASVRCPPGAVFDEVRRSCVSYASGGSKEDYTVDLGEWTRASYGSDGGSGTQALCSPLNKRPLTFGVGAGGSVRVRIDVRVHAPDRSVSRVQVVATGVVEPSGALVTAKGAVEINQSAQDIAKALAKQGGKANTMDASARVYCVIVNATRPVAVPATGGG